MNQAQIDSIQARLDAVYISDEVKPVCTPFNTLGAEMVQRLPDVSGHILVLSDLGLLFAVLRRLHLERRDSSKVRFIGHTDAQMKMNQELGVQGFLVCYNELPEWLRSSDMKMKFDVIIGNPPYQSDSNDGTRPLWPDFIDIGSKSLVNEGYLTMVVPQTWASNQLIPVRAAKNTSLVRSMSFSRGQLLEADFDISKYFPGVGSTFSTFLFKNTKIKSITKFNTFAGSFDLDYDNALWVPVNGDAKTISILQKFCWNKNSKIKWINGGREITGFRPGTPNTSRIKTETHVFPLANTSAQYSKGEFAYANAAHPAQFVSKVIVSGSGYPRPFFDKGEFGLSLHSRGVAAEDHDPEAVIAILNSKIVKFCAATKPASGSGSYVALIADVIPSVDSAMSDDELYDHFGLTREERELIERTIK